MKPKRTILCVDDDAQSLSVRKVLLETRGYRVVCCTSAEEALRAFAQGGIDLLLSDLVMPGMSGAELAAKIKARSPIPVILFTGKTNVYHQEQVADVFVPKGMCTPAELLERIRLLLVRKRGPKRANPGPSGFSARAV
jgi:CheY-like chemotaxis protein